jgi:ABC-type lipoprotein export system ATPase subunit
MIVFKKVTKHYSGNGGEVKALDGVDLEIPKGACVAVTGPSGCGKSTLLNILGGLDTPDLGEVWVEETPLHSASDHILTQYRRHQVGIVFQFFNLLPSMTVYENVELPLLLRGEARDVARTKVGDLLELVGLSPRSRHFPHQLSGGEMQRAALARGLIGNPGLLLADEPTGNLDTTNAAHVTETLLKIASQGKVTMVIVTHSAELAEKMPQRLAMRDGKIV